MNKRRAITLGVTGFIICAGGVILCALLYLMTVTFVEGSSNRESESDSSSFMQAVNGNVAWCFGLLYIVSGAIGYIAAFVQNKCMYVVTCIVSVICLVIMGLLVIASGLAIIVTFSMGVTTRQCTDTNAGCTCRITSTNSRQFESQIISFPFKKCEYYQKFTNLMIATLSLNAVIWVGVIVELIITCYFLCRGQTTEGMVIAPVQQPMLPPGPTYYQISSPSPLAKVSTPS